MEEKIKRDKDEANDLETIDIDAIKDWIKLNTEALLNQQELNNYLQFNNITNVKIYDEVNYFDLPKFLINYDYGVVLYKGHIPNYIYNVPNKVFEYLSCGLNVLYSNKLLSINNFKKINNINNIIDFDFENPLFLATTDINRKKFYNFSDNLYFEKLISNF